MTMFDIHCHALPNIDDGPNTIDLSLRMLRQASKEGILGVILTPHTGLPNNSSQQEILYRYDTFKKEAKAAGVTAELYLGSEIHCTKSTSKEIRANELLTLNRSRYVLLELSFDKYKAEYDDLFYDLTIQGKIPIIAHVERYPYIQTNPNMVHDLIAKGCLIQVNQDSLTGHNGIAIQQLTHLLIEHHLVHFVCSDAHNMTRRLTLKQAHKIIIQKYGIDYAFELFGRNPLSVIQNQNILIRKPYLIKESSRILSRIKQVTTQLVGIR